MNKSIIAVVDDFPDVLALMAEILDDAGYVVVTGESADEVERIVEQEHPGLLILDHRLPGSVTGLPLVRAIRENPATAKLPILIATADVTFLRENAAALKALGCETLVKPFDLDAFLGCVGSLTPPCIAAD